MVRRLATKALIGLVAVCWLLGQSNGDSIDLFDGSKIDGAIDSYRDGTLIVRGAGDEVKSVLIEDATSVSFDPRTSTENENRRLVFPGHPGDESPVLLRAGYHKLVFVYAGKAPQLQYSLDGEIPTLFPQSQYYAPEKVKNFKTSPGLDRDGYRLPESPGNVRPGATFRQYSSRFPIKADSLTEVPLKLVKSGRNDDISSTWSETSRTLGIFTVLVKLEKDGEYRFILAGNKKALLYLGATPPEILAMMQRKESLKADWLVDLAAGGTIAGSIESWNDEVVRLKTLYEQLPMLELPVEHVRRLTRTGEQSSPLAESESDEDIVIAQVNDDRTTRIIGRVNGLADGKLSVRYKGKDRAISLDKVAEISLGGPKYTVPRICYQQLELSSVCNFPTTLQSVTSTGIIAKTAWGQQVSVRHDGAALLRMSIRNGRVQYLSEIAPTTVQETPFFDRMMHWKANQSLTGSSLTIGAKEYRRGLAMHSRTKLGYDLAGGYGQFIAVVGIAPEVKNLGDAIVQVVGDDQVLFESQVDGNENLDINVDVSGVQLLTLVTDFGEGQDVGDRVHWGDARIVRQQGE